MATPVVGHDYQYTIEQESTFGTAVDSTATSIATESMEINHDPKIHQIARASGERGQSEVDTWSDQVGSIPTTSVSFPATPASLNYLKAVLQKDSAWAQATDTWTIYTNNYSALPDFSDDEGYFYTLVANSPVAAYDERIVSAVGSSFKLSIDPEANEGCLTAEVEFAGKSSAKGVTSSATVSDPVLTSLYKWSSLDSFLINATQASADFYSFEINVANGAKFVPAGGGDNVVLPRWEVTGSFTILGGSTAETYKAYPLATAASAAIPLVLTIDDFILTSYVYLTAFSEDKGEEEKVTFEFTGVFGGAGEYPCMVAWDET
jgi:hypothetical protein